MTRYTQVVEPDVSAESPTEARPHPASIGRFHALDCVRATAILLGVFYHAIQFASFVSGRFEMGGASMRLQGWLHCCRMPSGEAEKICG